MARARWWLAAVVSVAATAGCALFQPGATPVADGVTVLAKLDGWSAPLSTDESLGVNVVVEIAYDEDAARSAWDAAAAGELPERSGEPRDAGRYGSLDDVDLADQVVVVYSAGQSSACPGWLADIAVEGSLVVLEETEHVPGNGCSDDFNPYRLVLAVDRDKVPAAEELPVRRVRVDDREYDGLVTTYPAA